MVRNKNKNKEGGGDKKKKVNNAGGGKAKVVKAKNNKQEKKGTTTSVTKEQVVDTSIQASSGSSCLFTFKERLIELEKLKKQLQRRKSKEDMMASGILSMCTRIPYYSTNNIQIESPTTEANKKENLTSTIESIIEKRPDQDEVEQHIVNPSGTNRRLSGHLVQTARALERNITCDKIDRHLHTRPDVDDLAQQHVIDPNVSASIQGVQRKLQRELSSNAVAHKLEKRPDMEQLKDQGVLLENNNNVAPGLVATQQKLERQMNADQVHQLLEHRPSQEQMIQEGIMENEKVAPSLMAKAKALERNLVSDQVQHLLETRPEIEELQHIVDKSDIAPSLQATKNDLEMQLKADLLSKHLRRRPSREELIDGGVLADDIDLPSPKTPPPAVGETTTTTVPLSGRAKYAISLKAASRLARDNLIDTEERGRLKDLILNDDTRIIAAIECFELDHDAEEMLDTFYRIAKLA